MKKCIYPSPLKILQEIITQLLNLSSPLPEPLIQQAIVECRIFACVFISALLRNVSQWEKKLKQLNRQPTIDFQDKITEYFGKLLKLTAKINSIIRELRLIRESVSRLSPMEAKALIREINLVDEYFYYRITDALSIILKYSEPLDKQFEFAEVKAFHKALQEIVDEYTKHAILSGFTVIPFDSSEREREYFLKRRGELKKRFWAVFFLNLRTAPFFPVQQQLGPMLAAGLAAIWAAIAQLFILDKILRNQNSFGFLEVSSLIIVFTAMFAYIIKDRIKEIGRSLFKGSIFRRIPDQSETIYYRDQSNAPKPIGRLTESAQFISQHKLPQSIRTIRAWTESQSLELEDNDNILHYSKEVMLSSLIHVHKRYPTRVIHDILRFNIDVCLSRLAEPTSILPLLATKENFNNDPRNIQVHTVNGSLEVQFVECPKTYSFDLALQYSGKHESNQFLFRKNQKRMEPFTKYYRLTLNKSGLLRIEPMRQGKRQHVHAPLS